MRTAALWDEWVDEDPLGDLLPGPLFGGSAAGGIPFLPDVFGADARLVVEAAFGADVTGNPDLWNWYDVTADVRQADGQKISISPVGRSDEASQSQPAGCGFQLDNTTGAYTANHPGSPWFPNVKRNTPIRVRLYVNGGWSTRFQGYANGWVPSWDTSCNLAVVTVSAAGILRRLNQGKTPLRSPLYRATSGSSPVAYWPLEDNSSATQAASGVAGGVPLKVTDTAPKFGATAMTGSAPVADFSTGGQLATTITPTQTTAWRIEFTAVFPSSGNVTPGTHIMPVRWYTQGSITEWFIEVVNISGNLVEVGYRPNDGSGLFEIIGSFNPFDGLTHQIRVDASQNGANILVILSIDGVLNASWGGTTATLGAITGVAINPEAITSTSMPAIGHLAIWAPYAANVNTASAAAGYAGETATARLARLCGEQGVPIAITGTSDTAMGAQTVDTFVNLIRECETTDDGLLYDGLGAGVGYATRQSRYNSTASISPDMSTDPPQVGNPFAPADDDQRNRNIVKVSRKNGSSASFEDSTGPLGTGKIQDYDTSITVNTQTDDVLDDRAAWEVHKGTVRGFRYPTLNLDLAAVSTLARPWLSTQLAARMDVLNVTSKATQHPPGTVSLLLEGYSEVLGPFDWTVSANCSPYEPWRVAVIEGTATDTTWRVDSGASTLASDYAAGATSIQVNVTDGYLWSTSSGDYPRDIDVGGVQVTVSAVAGGSSPQTFTVTALSYPLHAGWSVSLWRPPVIAL